MKFKYLRTSIVNFEGKEFEIDVYEETKTKKFLFVDTKTMTRISLGGRMGEEV